MALGDPTRRAILQRLSRGAARITDLARPFDISLNSVSKHILILERARLVRRRRTGREHILSLEPRTMDEAADWIETHRAQRNRRLDSMESHLEAEDRAADRAEKDAGRAIWP